MPVWKEDGPPPVDFDFSKLSKDGEDGEVNNNTSKFNKSTKKGFDLDDLLFGSVAASKITDTEE